MMTQEEYLDIPGLKRKGWTLQQIAEEVGYHPATVREWIRRGGPPQKRQVDPVNLVINEHWANEIAMLLRANPNLLATSVERLLRAKGFTGSYPTLARYLCEVRGPRRGRQVEVSVPIETAPGEEFQFDWSDCCDFARLWGWEQLHCFGAILCYCRRRHWWFTDSIDRHHTFEGLVRFFEDTGGIPGIGRTDRMGCLGRSRGRAFHWFPESLEFAAYHGFSFKACQAGDAKRKGKVERPFWEMKEAFLQEVTVTGPPASMDELNRRADEWLERNVHHRPHRVTGMAPAERLKDELGLLGPLPRLRFDTSKRESRQVGQAVPMIEVDGVFYSVPPALAGQIVEVRLPVDQGIIQVRHQGELQVAHKISPSGSEPVWDPSHRREAEQIALSRHRRTPRSCPQEQVVVDLLDLGEGDYDIEPVELEAYDPDSAGCGCGRAGGVR
jgi:transposase